MPSLGDVANQVLNTLNDIDNKTVGLQTTATAIKNDSDDIKTKLDGIKTSLDTGVATLAGGLFAINENEKLADVLLKDLVGENQTIICLLKTSNDLLCRILHELQKDTAIQTTMRDGLVALEQVLELVHARETVEVERLGLVKARLEKCCPPRVPDPEKCFDPCPETKITIYEPKGQDWTPPQNQVILRAPK
jgi:hypothetical protein